MLVYVFHLTGDIEERKHHIECHDFVLLSEDNNNIQLISVQNAQPSSFEVKDNIFNSDEMTSLSKYIKEQTRHSFAKGKNVDLTFAIRAMKKVSPYKYNDFALAICKTEIWLCRKSLVES